MSIVLSESTPTAKKSHTCRVYQVGGFFLTGGFRVYQVGALAVNHTIFLFSFEEKKGDPKDD